MKQGRIDMRITKKLAGLLLVVALIWSVVPRTALAAEVDHIPTKVRVYSDLTVDTIKIELADVTQSINNLKTNHKNVTAMITELDYRSEEGEGADTSKNKNEYSIGLMIKKYGTYTVSFDIIDKDNNVVETKEVKVYYYDAPIKSITFDGKAQTSSNISGKSAKVKVTLTDGNTIKKLQYSIYKLNSKGNSASSELVSKTFKNGGKITFGTQSYYYSNDYSYDFSDYTTTTKFYTTNFTCPTDISITYYDNYTKQNETYTLSYYKRME